MFELTYSVDTVELMAPVNAYTGVRQSRWKLRNVRSYDESFSRSRLAVGARGPPLF